jgi:hypothetical protein
MDTSTSYRYEQLAELIVGMIDNRACVERRHGTGDPPAGPVSTNATRALSVGRTFIHRSDRVANALCDPRVERCVDEHAEVWPTIDGEQ